VSFQKVEVKVKVIRSVAHFTAPSRCHLTLGRRQPTPLDSYDATDLIQLGWVPSRPKALE